MGNTSDLARKYQKLGWQVIPLHSGTKKPMDNQWQRRPMGDPSLLEQFDRQDTNIGVVLGINGLVDIDLDSKEAVKLAPFFLPKTGMIFGRKGKRRSHWMYQVTEQAKYKKFSLADGKTLLELRSDGHQTMLPGSIHPSGDPIEWDTQEGLLEIGAAELLICCGKLAAAANLARNWPMEGNRHLAALHLAGSLIRIGWQLSDIEEFVECVCRQVGDRELGDRIRTVRDTYKSWDEGAMTTGWPSLSEIIGEKDVTRIREWVSDGLVSQKFPLTDLGNTERLIYHFGHNIKYCPQIGKWLIWDGRRWAEDVGESVVQLAADTVKKIYEEAAHEPDSDRQAAIAKWAIASQSVSHLLAIPRLAKSYVDIQVASEDLDRDPWLFNCPNGTLNLRTGGLQPFSKEDYLTKMGGCPYDPTATSPRWEEFLFQVMDDNEDMCEFLRRSIGYALTGNVGEQRAFMLYGTGANGKTVFLEVTRSFMGEYARNTEFSTFLQKNNDGIRTDIARLRGARYVTASESEEGRRLAPALIKSLTGGELVTARFLYQSEFEYRPSMHIFMATNHRPVVRDSSLGFWRRIALIPFTVTMAEDDQDKDLTQRLISSELAGIFNWAVRGCFEWQEQGLGEPVEVVEARDNYRQDMDIIGDFLDEVCELDSEGRIPSSSLYRAYTGWSQRQNERPISTHTFRSMMSAKGFSVKRGRSGMIWHGIRLNIPEMIEDDDDDSDLEGGDVE